MQLLFNFKDKDEKMSALLSYNIQCKLTVWLVRFELGEIISPMLNFFFVLVFTWQDNVKEAGNEVDVQTK